MKQAASDLTLAIRVKNGLALSDRDKINEVLLVNKIIGRFFEGTEIGPVSDVPLWGAVHSILYFCSVVTLSSRVIEKWLKLKQKNRNRMLDSDGEAMQEAINVCAQGLPELVGIREHGWNILLAEAVDPKGDYIDDRQERLKSMREWVRWASNPYDEQHGSANVPIERRQRFYDFKTEQVNEEFPTPAIAYWPLWTKPDYVSWYVNSYPMPRKADG